jgi:hypothetical protein
MLEGTSTLKMVEKFIGTVKIHHPGCKITEGNLKIRSLVNSQTKQHIGNLAAQSLRFAALFNKLNLQLRYSIMSLLSCNKV